VLRRSESGKRYLSRHSLPPHGPFQLHFLDRKTTYTCRCGWNGQSRAIAIMDGDWRTPI